MKICGQRILELREQMGLTQEELSSRLQITRASLSHYETGRRTPDYELLQRIADFFQVSVDYLIGRVDDPNPAAIRKFEESLELSDEKILERFTLTVDGQELTPEEAKRFIAFIRAERAMRSSE